MPRFRRTQSFSVRVFSSISNRYTQYPGQSKILVNSRSVNPASLAHPFTFLRRAIFATVLTIKETAKFCPNNGVRLSFYREPGPAMLCTVVDQESVTDRS